MKRQRVRYFTESEKKRFLEFLGNRADAKRAEFLYKLMFATGLRLRETANLNIDDVLDRDRLDLIGKGDKQREIPLSRAIRLEIQKFIEWKRIHGEDISKQAPLFISRKRRRLGCRAIQHDLDKWVKLAGIEGKYSPHALRHTVGFELMHKTKNIRFVQEFLGHSSITTTQIYTHVTKEDLQQCAELLII